MAKVSAPIFNLPKKRNGRKQPPINAHADHIISIQGAETDYPLKLKNNLHSSPVTEHVVNGIIHSTMEGLKSNMKMNLPIINDVLDEDATEPDNMESNKPMTVEKNHYLHLNSSREIIDLSPIYENSSDACSSHNDLEEINETKNFKMTNSDLNESSSATPNSVSQTLSENSFEMNTLTDSLKGSAKKKKKVNIVSEVTEAENTDTELTALRFASEGSLSPECSLTETGKDSYVTMTGTIKRGKKKGQNVDVKVNLSREQLEIIEAAIIDDENNKLNVSQCSLLRGPHIFIFSLLCLPIVTCISAVYSFYIGTTTWYNIFTFITEETNCIKKVLFAPIVILSYPFLILVYTVALGLYAGVVQVSVNGKNWWKEVVDLEKGFYGWFCNVIGLPECSPYEVIILVDVKG